MAKKKKIEVGWVMMRLNKSGNWVQLETGDYRFEVIEKYEAFKEYKYGDYKKGLRAGTLKVKKMYVTM